MPKGEIEKVIEYLQNEKEKELKKDLDRFIKGDKIKEIDQLKLLEQEENEEKIQTGTLIDDMIGGGLPPSTEKAVSSLLLYGEYGSGKTQTCFTMCVECPYDVIYIDLEGSYRAQRIKQIADQRGKDFKEVIKKIHLFRPDGWVEQMMVIKSLPSPADAVTGKIGLIIVDSWTKEFRGIEFQGRQNLNLKMPLLREFGLMIEKIVKSYECALVYTTQVYSTPQAGGNLPDWTTLTAVGGHSILHQPAFIVFFRRVTGKNIRIGRMMDSSWQALREVPFCITDKGVENLPENAEEAQKMLDKVAKFEAKQKSELMVKNEPLCGQCGHYDPDEKFCNKQSKKIRRQRTKCEDFIILVPKQEEEEKTA